MEGTVALSFRLSYAKREKRTAHAKWAEPSFTCGRRTAKQKLDMVGKLQKPGGLMRAVGPAAAARLMRIMTATDPDMPLQDIA